MISTGIWGPSGSCRLELEQILLNLVNNSLDSLRSKLEAAKAGARALEISTGTDDTTASSGRRSPFMIQVKGSRRRHEKLIQTLLHDQASRRRYRLGPGDLPAARTQVRRRADDRLQEGSWTRVTLGFRISFLL